MSVEEKGRIYRCSVRKGSWRKKGRKNARRGWKVGMKEKERTMLARAMSEK